MEKSKIEKLIIEERKKEDIMIRHAIEYAESCKSFYEQCGDVYKGYNLFEDLCLSKRYLIAMTNWARLNKLNIKVVDLRCKYYKVYIELKRDEPIKKVSVPVKADEQKQSDVPKQQTYNEDKIIIRAQNIGKCKMQNVGYLYYVTHAWLSDGSERDLFTFYPDEYTICANSIVGKTIDQAVEYFERIDGAYLRS